MADSTPTPTTPLQRLVQAAVFLVALAGIAAFIIWSIQDNRSREHPQESQSVAPAPPASPSTPPTIPSRRGGPTTFRIRPNVAPTPAAPPVNTKSTKSPATRPIQLSLANVPKSWTAPDQPTPVAPTTPRARAAPPDSPKPQTPETAPVVLRFGALTVPSPPVHTHAREPSVDAVVPLPPREIFNWDDPKHAPIVAWLTAWDKRLAAAKPTTDEQLADLTSILYSNNCQLTTPQLRQVGHAAEFLEPGPLAITFYRAAIERAPRDLAGLAIDSPEAQQIGRAVSLCYMPFWTMHRDAREEQIMSLAFRVMFPFQSPGSYEAYKCAIYGAAADYMQGSWHGDREAAKRALAAYQAILDDPHFADLPAKEVGQVHLHMGYIYFNTGRYELALPKLKAGKVADDYIPQSVFPMLIRASAATGQLDDANTYLQQYIQSCNPPPQAVKQLSDFIDSATTRPAPASSPTTQP